MKFAVAVVNDGFDRFRDRVTLVERMGFDRVCFGDNQSVYREAWISHASVARETSRIGMWLTVTNPETRHLAVTAAAASSMSELSGGRFALGLGTAFSALGALGQRPVTVARLRAALVGLRSFWNGEDVEWAGGTGRLAWPAQAVPLSIAAAGPKTLRLAGELCDEVIVGSGLDTESVRTALGHIEAGGAVAGRPTSEVRPWFYAKCSIADTREEAVDAIRGLLAGSAAFSFRDGTDERLPPALRAKVNALQERYSLREHSVAGAAHNAELVDDPELSLFLADRFGLVGTPADIVDKLTALRAVGVERVLITALGHDPETLIRRFADEVIPSVREPVGRQDDKQEGA